MEPGWTPLLHRCKRSHPICPLANQCVAGNGTDFGIRHPTCRQLGKTIRLPALHFYDFCSHRSSSVSLLHNQGRSSYRTVCPKIFPRDTKESLIIAFISPELRWIVHWRNAYNIINWDFHDYS